MSSNPHAQGVYRLPDSLTEELENLREMVVQLKDGDVSAVQFRSFRVPLGV